VVPTVLLETPLVQTPGVESPDGKVDDRSDPEESLTEVERLLLQDRVLVRRARGGPAVDPWRRKDDYEREHEHHGQHARGRFQHAPDGEAPAAADDVVQHQEAERATGGAHPKEE